VVTIITASLGEIPLTTLHHELKRLVFLAKMEASLGLVRNKSHITVIVDVVASLVFDVGDLITKQMDVLHLMKKLINARPLLQLKLVKLQKIHGILTLEQTSI
jgi:hypothetical protein